MKRASRIGIPAILLACLLASAGCGRRGNPSNASEAPASASGAENSREPANSDDDGTDPEVEPGALDDPELRYILGVDPLPDLYLDDLLTVSLVRRFTHARGALEVKPLGTREAAPNYNALRIGYRDRLGVVLQVWYEGEQRRVLPAFDRLRATWLETEDLPRFADRAFTSEFEQIRHVVFADVESAMLVALSCDRALCTPVQLRHLARHIHDRIQESAGQP